MVTQYKASLTDLLGEDVEKKAKLHFFQQLNEYLKAYQAHTGAPIAPEAERLVMLAFEVGWNFYHNLVFEAVARGDITITITDEEGTLWQFTPSP